MLRKIPSHILLVSEPCLYGAFLYVRKLVRYLHGHYPELTVDLAYSSRRSWPEKIADLTEEIRAHGGEAIDLRVTNNPEPRDLMALCRLIRLIWRRSPQLIHAHSSKAGGLCRLLALLPGSPPVLYTPHAYYGMARKGGKKEKFFNLLESLLGRIGCSAVFCADERRFALEMLKLPARSLVLINPGIFTDQFVPANEAARFAARKELGVPQNGKLLITIGRDSPQKNYAPLYAALNHLLVKPSIYFAHVGEGALKRREELDVIVRERCYSYDYLEDIRSLLWAADGFILTSFYESMPSSMLEAASCGIPLLLTDAPGLSVMRAHGLEVNWLPDPSHSPNFEVEVLKSLAIWEQHPAATLSDQHEFIRRNFNVLTQFGKVVRLYEWLIGARNA